MAHGNTVGLHPYVKNPPKKVPRGTRRIFQDENNHNLTCAVWFDTKPVPIQKVQANCIVIVK